MARNQNRRKLARRIGAEIAYGIGQRAARHERHRHRRRERAPARRRGRRTRQRGDAAAQLRARLLARHARGDRPAQCDETGMGGGKRGVGGEALLELQRMGGIELAVHIGVEQQAVVSHVSLLPNVSAPNVSIKRSRARASRDITVPIGTPVTSAISR